VFRHLFDVALEDVHQRGLGLVVEIVARQEEVGLERFGVLREEVSPEDAAVGTGAMFSGVVFDDVVHLDAELLLVADEFVADSQLLAEFDAGLDRFVAVALDPLVNRQADEFDAGSSVNVSWRICVRTTLSFRRRGRSPRSVGSLALYRGDEIVPSDPATYPLFDRLAEVVRTEVGSGVRGVHDRLLVAPVTVH